VAGPLTLTVILRIKLFNRITTDRDALAGTAPEQRMKNPSANDNDSPPKDTSGAVTGGEAARPAQSRHDARQPDKKDTEAEPTNRAENPPPPKKDQRGKIYGPGL
jgi:hypothetical protein